MRIGKGMEKKMESKIVIREIFFGTPEHAQELELRNEVLRKPLGLNIYDQDLAAEKYSIRIGAFLARQQNQRVGASVAVEAAVETNSAVPSSKTNPESQRDSEAELASAPGLPLLTPESQLEQATEAGSDFSIEPGDPSNSYFKADSATASASDASVASGLTLHSEFPPDSADWKLIHNINSFHRDASNRMSRPPGLDTPGLDPHSDLLLGCLLLFSLEDEPGSWQLRQMAVDENYRHLGIGRRMLEFAEVLVRKKEEGLPNQKDRQAIKLILNARKEAQGFYEKSGYKVVSSEFLELGIPHYRMEKLLILQ